MSNTVRERNCTQQEITPLLAVDVKEGKSSSEFKRINDASRQRTSENSLYYFHRSAYPGALCDDKREVVADKYDVALALKRIGQSAYMNPRSRELVRAPAKLTNHRLYYSKHDPLPTAPPLREIESSLSKADEALVADAKSLPYDREPQESLGPIQSLYREDYCRTRETGFSQTLPRPPAPDAAPAAQGDAAKAVDPATLRTTAAAKKDYLYGQLYLAELEKVEGADRRRQVQSAKDRSSARNLAKAQENLNLRMRRNIEQSKDSLITPSTQSAKSSVGNRTPSTTPSKLSRGSSSLPNVNRPGTASSSYVSVTRSYFMNRASYSR